MADVVVPAAPPLASLNRVELIHTGDWQISSGRWRASRDDLAAAVAARECKAVRRPVLKLGHSHGEQPLWAGNPTGAPAVGWVDNLALTDHGHTLVGDLVGLPGWLASPDGHGRTVLSAAYPDRSVEGSYDWRCQLGHTHPFVVSAVALLGVTPPGVGTLKSLQDVGALYGVQAAESGGVRVEARFDPDQPRDAAGRWTDGLPGVLAAGQAARRLAADIYRTGRVEGEQDLLADLWDTGLVDAPAVDWAVARGVPDVRAGIGDRTATQNTQIDQVKDLLADAADDPWAVYEQVYGRGVGDGVNTLLADMWHAGVAGVEAVEFAVMNSSAADPRKPVTPVRAAADVHTGAMVALVPADEDLDRLAVPGGEASGQLHTTLLYLGEAAAYSPAVRARLVAELRDLAAVIPPGGVDGMAVAAYNPHRDDMDTTIVLELSGDGLDDVHGLVEDTVTETAADVGLALPEQHTPWRPHVTLIYSDDLTQVPGLADRAGPVRFDRLRVAFAGETVDVPLTGQGSDDDFDGLTDDDMPDPDTVEAARSQTRRITRSDAPLRRYWLRGKGALKIRWNTPGDWTRCVRQLRKYVRDPKGLCAVYHRQATGVWPGDRRNVGRHASAAAGFDPDQPRVPRGMPGGGQWVDVMHPATLNEIADFRTRFGRAIPPGWSDVHIADDLDTASLLVTGRDVKGRRQAIYSAEHTAGQAVEKFARVQALNGHLDKLDHALERDAGVSDDAAASLLIRRLGMRPGSARDTAAEKRAYGATTLLARHVTVDDGTARFDFTGKDGVHIQLETADPLIVKVLAGRLVSRSGDDRLFDTSQARTRDYMHSTGVPQEFLLKDLRTLLANVLALREIQARDGTPGSKREFQSWRRQVATAVSRALGNTPTLALSSYINPTVFGAWAEDPAWVAAAVGVVGRVEEKRLLAGWFATVAFDEPESGIPPVDPDPDDPDDDSRQVEASTQEEAVVLPNPNPTVIHAAAGVSVDDVRAAYYRQAPQQAWIREFHTHPRRLIVANDADGTVARVDFDVDDDGQIRFGVPVPVRVEYVEQDTDAEMVAASRMVYASAAESRPVTANVPGGHNQLTHGNRYGPDGKLLPRAGAIGDVIRDVYSALTRGEGASIDAGELDGLLRTLTGGGDEAKRANLARLDVGGYGTLFATDKTGALDRSKMPQLGTNEQEMRPFLDLLRDRGVSVSVGEIDPTTLKPSQSEISGAKTGKLYGFMAKDGWLPGGLLVTSADGYVVDGHHRWSAAAAVRAAGTRPDMTVTGLIVDAPIDEVLQLAASVAKFESLEFDREPAAAAASVSNRAWSVFTEADYTLEQFRRACLIVRGDGTTKEQMSLPVREPAGSLNRNAVHAAAGGHGLMAVENISPQVRRSTARKLVGLYRQIGDTPPDSLREMAGMSMSAAVPPPKTPAAEPGNPTTKEEEIMPLSTEVYQRLGLAEDADPDAVNDAVLAALDKAEAQSDPQQVAAAAAERDGLVKEVNLLKGQVEAMSGKLATAEAAKAATVKASVLDTAQQQGKFTPADRPQWDKDYDDAPQVVTRVLASIATGTAVPVNVNGSVGQPLDVAASDDDLDPEPEWLFGPADTEEPAMAGKES